MAIGEKGLAEAAATPAPARSHYLAKCILRGSAVLHAVQGRFRFPSSSDVVFGKVLISCQILLSCNQIRSSDPKLLAIILSKKKISVEIIIKNYQISSSS